jgi:hypothetical protein
MNNFAKVLKEHAAVWFQAFQPWKKGSDLLSTNPLRQGKKTGQKLLIYLTNLNSHLTPYLQSDMHKFKNG